MFRKYLILSVLCITNAFGEGSVSTDTSPKFRLVNGTCEEIPEDPITTEELLGRLALTVGLVALSALFSGLTLGVLGLDTLSLEVIADSGPDPDRLYAAQILPIRKNGNQLLCTLLLGNVMTNVLISLLTERLTNGILGFVISTVTILLFCEIIPQSACSKYALLVGAKSLPLVNFFTVLLYVFTKPIALVLDWWLGEDPGQIYDRNMLRKLIAMHAKEHSKESGIRPDDFTLMAGAIDFEHRHVSDVMTPLDDVFMLEKSTRITEEVLLQVWEVGHSRVPVYDQERWRVIGILYVKDLIFLDTEEKLSVETVLKLSSKSRKLHFTFDDMKLKTLLTSFASGHSHLALVQTVQNIASPTCDPTYQVIGIVTLEDVIEELIRTDIKDEEDREEEEHITRMSVADFRYSKGRPARLGEAQLKAVIGYLRDSVEQFQYMDSEALKMLARNSQVLDVKAGHVLLQRGAKVTHFVLLINGRIELRIGTEDVRAELPSWSVFGSSCLLSTTSTGGRIASSSPILAEYTAVASVPCRILMISPEIYAKADAMVRAAAQQRKKVPTTAVGGHVPPSHEGVELEEREGTRLLSFD